MNPFDQSTAESVVFRGRELPFGPLIYKKRLLRPDTPTPAGVYARLVDPDGKVLAKGLYNRRSEIGFRILGGPAAPDSLRALTQHRLKAALRLREDTLGLSRRSTAYRLVNSEGDGLSGLVIDRYGDTLVVSLYSLGWLTVAEGLESTLAQIPGIQRVLFRADERTQKLEGFRLPELAGGQSTVIKEGKLQYRVDLSTGHKTGLFLDQRDNRVRISQLAEGRRVLDLCTNAGGFALACAGPGKAKEVTAVDLDEKALAAAQQNARLNELRIPFVHADLFPYLRERAQGKERYDLIILDPPKLAAGPKEVESALVRYRDMNRWAFEVLAPEGLLFTCSCSGAVDEGRFASVVRQAAHMAGRTGRILEHRGPAPDHPVALDHPEGRYLKALLVHVD